MKLKNLVGWSSALCLSAGIVQAQETNQTEKLEKQLKEMQENFEKQQRELRDSFEKMMRQQQEQIDALKKQIATATNAVTGTVQTNQAAEAEKKKLEQQLAVELQTNQPPVAAQPNAPPLTTAWSPAQPLTIARAGSAYMNISFDALTDFGWSSASDPSQFLELGDKFINLPRFLGHDLQTDPFNAGARVL